MPFRCLLRLASRTVFVLSLNHSVLPLLCNAQTHFSVSLIRSSAPIHTTSSHSCICNSPPSPSSTSMVVSQLCSHGLVADCALFSCIVAKIMEIIINREDIEVRLDGLALKNLNPDIVCEVLRTVQRKFLQNAESQGTQKDSRRRSPIVQRYLWKEAEALENNEPIKGPQARRNPLLVKLGVAKALRFYSWAEEQRGYDHTQLTCKEMAWTLARANKLKMLWRFLHEMARKDKGLVTTKTVTSVIQVLGEEGLVKEALACFYRMNQFHCKPDVISYNTIINALCMIRNFKKARFLFDQMRMPGSRCPPDTFTYTILINGYCKFSMQTKNSRVVCKKLYDANRLFRDMCDDGFLPDVVTYNCLIDGMCKKYRIDRAIELFDHMSRNGCAPNKVTYNSFIRYYSTVNEIDKALVMLNEMRRSNIIATSSSYTPILHALCEAERLDEARKLLVEMVEEKSIPRSYTYYLIIDALSKAGKAGLPAELCQRIENDIEARHDYVKKVKNIIYT